MALGEEQVHGGEHRREPVGQLVGRWHLVGDGLVGQPALGPHQPLRHRCFRDQEESSDLGRRQTAERPQREGHAALDRQRRVARGEDQPEEVVADDLRVGIVPPIQGGEAPVGGALLVVSLGVPAEPVDRLVPGDRGDPGAGLVGDPGPRPLLERDHERILHRVLGAIEVAEDAGEGGESRRRFGTERGLGRDLRQSEVLKSMHGWTTTRPSHVPGIWLAHSIAASMSSASSR